MSERADDVELVEAFHRTGELRYRNELVERHQDTAEYFVRRYRGRGVPEDDIRQVALLGVVRAADRFDPDREVGFATFASRTIDGDIKRYFRDRTWSVRPPRRLQELHLELRRAEDDLSQELGRPPRPADLAERLGTSVDAVLEAMDARAGYRSSSIDRPATFDDDSAGADSRLGAIEGGFDAIEDRELVHELLASLPERERTVLELRFFERLTQPEIAERVGVSQSYLSRLLRRTLGALREQLLEASATDSADGVVDE